MAIPRKLANYLRRFAPDMDDAALVNLQAILGIAGIIIGSVVAIVLIAALMPTYLGAVEDVTDNFTKDNVTVGDSTADSLLPVFGLLVSFAGLFAIVGLVFVAVRFRGKR